MEVYDELEKTLKELEKKDKVINDLLSKISDLEFEVERLNNNWNKLEEWLNIQQNISSPEQIINDIFDKIKKLKGVDKE